MKNIHILPTDQPSRLAFDMDENFYLLCEEPVFFKLQELVENRNIYITSDEEIKKDEYYLGDDNHIYNLVTSVNNNGKKIVLTTDPTLIVDGVQSINDEFLEWFVKNPTCEFVDVEETGPGFPAGIYWINYLPEHFEKSIPQEEPKQEFPFFDKEKADAITKSGRELVRELQSRTEQETLEEAAENESEYLADWEDKSMYVRGFVDGAIWQAERMYTEADNIMRFLDTEVELKLSDTKTIERIKWYFKTYFEQFKKK